MTSARAVALRALVALAKGKVARLRDELERVRIEPREMALAFELAHGVLRRERLLDFVLTPFAHRGLPPDAMLRMALRLGAQQLLFVRGMPARAAVHETVDLLRDNRAFANALLRRVAERLDDRTADPARPLDELPLSPTRCLRLAQPLPTDAVTRLAIVHSLPDFLVRRWTDAFGAAAAAATAAAASAVPAVFLRAMAHIGGDALRTRLADEGVVTSPTAHALLLRWDDGGSPFATRAFADGWFLVQDPTALRAAEAVPCRPGDTVIDLCAAPGTKTMRLCERVGPTGLVYAFDVDGQRRTQIVANAERLRQTDRLRVVETAAALPVADVVLADVPCSNSGVLARRVEVRRRLRDDTAASLAITQQQILLQAVDRCRPGGAIVYSTCSIDTDENQGVVAAVRSQRPDLQVEREELTLPQEGVADGGYHAVLRRMR